MKIIIIFSLLSLINVMFSVVRELITVNGNKTIASLVNAGYFSFYNIVIIFTVADFNLAIKCAITFIANLIGVYVIKALEECKKAKEPDKLWKCEIAVPLEENPHDIHHVMEQRGIANNWNDLGSYHIFNCYCQTKTQTQICKNIATEKNGFISAYESAPL